MNATVSITKSQLFTALRSFLLGLFPDGWEVIEAQDNRVPMPAGNFIEMTATILNPLSTPKSTWVDPGTNPGSNQSVTSTQWRCQLDVYGPGAADVATTIANLVRTEYACDQFASSGIEMQPLYSEGPHNTTMINAEQQYEERWTLDFIAQFNPVVTTPLDFAGELNAELVEIDTTYR